MFPNWTDTSPFSGFRAGETIDISQNAGMEAWKASVRAARRKPYTKGVDTMAKYIFKRIIMAIVTIFAVASVTFFVMNMVPGGPFMSEKAISPQAQACLLYTSPAVTGHKTGKNELFRERCLRCGFLRGQRSVPSQAGHGDRGGRHA